VSRADNAPPSGPDRGGAPRRRREPGARRRRRHEPNQEAAHVHGGRPGGWCLPLLGHSQPDLRDAVMRLRATAQLRRQTPSLSERLRRQCDSASTTPGTSSSGCAPRTGRCALSLPGDSASNEHAADRRFDGMSSTQRRWSQGSPSLGLEITALLGLAQSQEGPPSALASEKGSTRSDLWCSEASLPSTEMPRE
jgi:hypothetical protein